MDITTILGLVFAIVGLLGSMVFKGVPFANLLNPAAFFIIILGTIGTVLNAFPLSDIKNFPKIMGVIFFEKKVQTNEEIIKVFVELSQLARKEGLLSLESKSDLIKDDVFKKGIELLMSGQGRDYIEEVLTDTVENMEERHQGNATIFSQAGTYAPTLGVMGAVVGLIAAMGFMDDTEQLAHAIGGAFMATIYGIFTGYVIWHPFGNKLKRKSKKEVVTKTIIIHGILLLEHGLSPNLVEESLNSYLPGGGTNSSKAGSKDSKKEE